MNAPVIFPWKHTPVLLHRFSRRKKNRNLQLIIRLFFVASLNNSHTLTLTPYQGYNFKKKYIYYFLRTNYCYVLLNFSMFCEQIMVTNYNIFGRCQYINYGDGGLLLSFLPGGATQYFVTFICTLRVYIYIYIYIYRSVHAIFFLF